MFVDSSLAINLLKDVCPTTTTHVQRMLVSNIHGIYDYSGLISWGAFDLLRNEGQDKTILVVQCSICKVVSGTGQIGGKKHDKN